MPSIIKTKKTKDKKYSKQVTYLFCALKGLFIFITGSLLLSFLLYKTQNNNLTLYIFFYILIAFGGFVSGFNSYKQLKGRGFLNGLIASGIYCGFILLIAIVLMKFSVSSQILLLIPVCITSGFIGGTVSANI